MRIFLTWLLLAEICVAAPIFSPSRILITSNGVPIGYATSIDFTNAGGSTAYGSIVRIGALSLGAGTSGTNFDSIIVTNKIIAPSSNNLEIASSANPARVIFVGTNDSREIHGQTAFFTNDVTLTAGKVITPPDGAGGEKAYLGAFDVQAGLFRQGNQIIAAYDSDTGFYRFAGSKFTYDTGSDANSFEASFNTFLGGASFAGQLVPGADNSYDNGRPNAGAGFQRWRDGWFANTINTTGLLAGITYVPLTSGSYTNSTNNFTVMMPNGSARTNWLNTAAGVGSIQIVKDDRGTAAGTNIIVKATTGTIDGATSYTLNTAFGAVWFQSDGTNWHGIAKF